MFEMNSPTNTNPDFESLAAKVWSAATALKVFGEIDQPVDGAMAADEFTLRTGNAWCRLIFDRPSNRITGTFGWYGNSFEVTAKELFVLNGSSFDDPEVMADLVIVELLRALTLTSSSP